jgi:glutaconate CoA-transferase, subunit B
VTDLCLMRPDPATRELVVTSLHDGVTREQVAENTGWAVRFADDLARTPPPTSRELDVLHDLRARTARAHGAPVSGA